jgi:hypothetical protein
MLGYVSSITTLGLRKADPSFKMFMLIKHFISEAPLSSFSLQLFCYTCRRMVFFCLFLFSCFWAAPITVGAKTVGCSCRLCLLFICSCFVVVEAPTVLKQQQNNNIGVADNNNKTTKTNKIFKT